MKKKLAVVSMAAVLGIVLLPRLAGSWDQGHGSYAETQHEAFCQALTKCSFQGARRTLSFFSAAKQQGIGCAVIDRHSKIHRFTLEQAFERINDCQN